MHWAQRRRLKMREWLKVIRLQCRSENAGVDSRGGKCGSLVVWLFHQLSMHCSSCIFHSAISALPRSTRDEMLTVYLFKAYCKPTLLYGYNMVFEYHRYTLMCSLYFISHFFFKHGVALYFKLLL